MKDMQTELCWSGMTDTEHSTTSHSNKKDRFLRLLHYLEQTDVDLLHLLKNLITKNVFLLTQKHNNVFGLTKLRHFSKKCTDTI